MNSNWLRAAVFGCLLANFALGPVACDRGSTSPNDTPPPDPPEPPFSNPDCIDYTSLHEGWNDMALPSAATAFAVEGHAGFAALSDGSLLLLELRGPETPRVADQMDFGFAAPSLAATAEYVAVAAHTSGLRIITRSGSDAFGAVHEWSDGSDVRSVGIAGDLVIAHVTGALQAFRIAADGTPEPAGRYPVSDVQSALWFQDRYVFLRVGPYDLKCVSFVDPDAPGELWSKSGMQDKDLMVGGGKLLVGDCPARGPRSLVVYDLTHVETAHFVGGSELTVCQFPMNYSDNRFYVLRSDALVEYRPDDLLTLEPRSETPIERLTGAWSRPVVVDGYIYRAGATLRWAGLNRPTTDPRQGEAQAVGVCVWMARRGNVLFATAESYALYAYDVSDPADIRYLGWIRHGGTFHGLIERDPYVFFGNNEWLVTVDASDPTAMQWMHNTVFNTWISDIAQLDQYIYVQLDDGHLAVLDATDPLDPQVLQTVDSPMPGRFLEANDSHLFVLQYGPGGEAGVAIFGVDDRDSPTLVATMGEDGTRWAALEAWDDVFVLGGNGHPVEFYRLDATEQPQPIGRIDTVLNAARFTYFEGTLYIARPNSIEVYDVSDLAAPRYIGATRTLATAAIHTDGYNLYGSGYRHPFESFLAQCIPE